MDLTIFETNPDLEVGGVWVDIEFRGQTGRFKVARAGNPKFTRIFTKLKNSRHFVDEDSDGAVEHEKECINRAMAEAILIDTGKEITSDGKKVKYTPELGYELMSNPAYTELKNQISFAAGDFEQYAVVKLEGIEGN